MRPDELLIALHSMGITVAPNGEHLHVTAPKGAITPVLAAALREHKALILTVFRTLPNRERDADWETLRDWLVALIAREATRDTIPRAVITAGERTGIAYRDEWAEAYARKVRMALRARGLLAVFSDPPVALHEEGTAA